jgi:hypothetical protein
MSMRGRKRYFGLAVVLVVAALLALPTRSPPHCSVRVSSYDSTTRAAGIVVSNNTAAAISYWCWQKDSDPANAIRYGIRAGLLDPHRASEIPFSVDVTFLPEIYVDATPAGNHSRSRRWTSLLDRFWVNVSSKQVASLSLMNGSNWVSSTKP